MHILLAGKLLPQRWPQLCGTLRGGHVCGRDGREHLRGLLAGLLQRRQGREHLRGVSGGDGEFGDIGDCLVVLCQLRGRALFGHSGAIMHFLCIGYIRPKRRFYCMCLLQFGLVFQNRR